MVISCTYWPKFNAKFCSILVICFKWGHWQFYVYCMPINHVKQLPVCQLFGSIFNIDLKYWMPYIIVTMLAYSMSNIWYTFYVCVFVLHVLVVLYWNWSFNCVMAGVALGYMLDWLGDVTFTVSFCQLSGCVCYHAICVHNLYALYGPICTYNSVNLLHFLSLLTNILSYFFLCFLYKFYPSVEPVYWFHMVIILPSHIIFPQLCWAWSALCVVTVNTDLHFV